MCLTGTALLGPLAGRSILVHNFGGLDWDRPVFGTFGTFSGGMFGLLPVYCRAEGYDFEVIDKTDRSVADGECRIEGRREGWFALPGRLAGADGASPKDASAAKTGSDGLRRARSSQPRPLGRRGSDVGESSKADSDGATTPRVDMAPQDNRGQSATAREDNAPADQAKREGTPVHAKPESGPRFVDTMWQGVLARFRGGARNAGIRSPRSLLRHADGLGPATGGTGDRHCEAWRARLKQAVSATPSR